MARPPSGKLLQCTEWWDFAGERMSGVCQLALFPGALPLAVAVTWTWYNEVRMVVSYVGAFHWPFLKP